MDWIRDFAMKENKVSKADLDLLHLTDSPAEIVQIIVDSQSALRALRKGLSDEYRAVIEP